MLAAPSLSLFSQTHSFLKYSASGNSFPIQPPTARTNWTKSPLWADFVIPPITMVALAVKNPFANAGDLRDEGSIPGLGKMLQKKKWQPTPVFLPGTSHGQRSLAGYSPWRRKKTGHDLGTKQQPPQIHVETSIPQQDAICRWEPHEVIRFR